MTRRPGPGWVPNQHGAWAMLLLPVVVGSVHAGPRWWHVLLTATWLVGYLAFFATGQWLRSRRRARYRPPVLVYGAATAVLGLAAVATAPAPLALLAWGAVYAPLLTVSLWHSWHRRDRSMANDLVTVVAAGLMAVVAHTPAWADAQAWAGAAVLVAYFAGTVLYVKTMIRERGSRSMYVASVGYHVAVACALAVAAVAAAAATSGSALLLPAAGWLAGLFTLLAVRAALVPRLWPTATPKAVGLGEVAASVALGLLLLA